MEINKEVIFFICNHGFAYEAMAEARKAGARGGTIIHGRSSVSTEKAKFFGITIHPEKDILMIVCLEEQRLGLMKAMTTKYGVTTEARGLCFSMKVEETLGFSFEPLPIPEIPNNE
ncbi:MAG: hypothetical protein WC479_01320 [Candidatus Izemoplasmatales bacterium]|jgi:hypothetical protein|nr:hypothetical protein [Candidatus Izemoplasmatales bacterium]MDD3865794.1 hypothetical protein [Candidatus Izemoplasmatales bacterium]